MKSIWHALLGSAIASICLLAVPFAQANPRPLVDAAWLQQALATGDVLVLDAQPGKLHEAGHIPGAVHVDLFAYRPDEADAQAMQRRIQSWGVSPGRTVVITTMAAAISRRACTTNCCTAGTRPSGCICSTAGWRSGGRSAER